MEWISVNDELPVYGEPIIVVDNGVTQNVTYMRDGSDDGDWFEPFFFDHDDNHRTKHVTHWMRLPMAPKS